jgi:hypothetical protein
VFFLVMMHSFRPLVWSLVWAVAWIVEELWGMLREPTMGRVLVWAGNVVIGFLAFRRQV